MSPIPYAAVLVSTKSLAPLAIRPASTVCAPALSMIGASGGNTLESSAYSASTAAVSLAFMAAAHAASTAFTESSAAPESAVSVVDLAAGVPDLGPQARTSPRQRREATRMGGVLSRGMKERFRPRQATVPVHFRQHSRIAMSKNRRSRGMGGNR